MSDDPKPLCVLCRRRHPALTLTLCRRCYDNTDTDLADILECYALASGELNPGRTGTGGTSTDPSIGIRVAALDLRAGGDALEHLARWEAHYRDTLGHSNSYSGTGTHQALDRYARGRRDPIGTTLVAVVGYLRTHLHTIAQGEVATFARDVHDIAGTARNAARLNTRPGWTIDCPADHDDETCGNPLRVTGEHYGSSVHCRRCGTMWDTERLMHVVAYTRDADVWLPAEDIALLYGISPRTLQRWARAGDIDRRDGRYRLESVRAAIQTGAARRERDA